MLTMFSPRFPRFAQGPAPVLFRLGTRLALFASLFWPCAGSAAPAYVPLQGEYVPPNALPPVTQEKPRPEPSTGARRRLEVGLGAQAATKLCPPNASNCALRPGWRGALSIASRPSPYLAWGLAATLTEYSEQFQHGSSRAEVAHRAFGAELFTKLFFLDRGAWDPYLSVGFGGGQHSSSGRLRQNDRRSIGRTGAEFNETTWAPSMSAAFGVDLIAGEGLRLGSEFSWTHWMVRAEERCGQVVFGMCSVAGWRQFTPRNAVWGLGLNATLLFGTPH
jgi:hypothetical protein